MWRMLGGYLAGALMVIGRSLVGVWGVLGGCLARVLRVFGGCYASYGVDSVSSKLIEEQPFGVVG